MQKLGEALTPFLPFSFLMLAAITCADRFNAPWITVAWMIIYFGTMAVWLLYVYQKWPFKKR